MLLTMTISAAARELGVCRNTVYALIRAGEIRPTRIHQRPRIRRSELERLLTRNTPR